MATAPTLSPRKREREYGHQQGFTLIELAIVLVVIGLIVGGVLVGQDMIKAAEARAQISQIEKFNTAVNTFRGKYGALPGDITQTAVTQFGFTGSPTRAGGTGGGDGNGIIQSYCCGVGFTDDLTNGETSWFWVDLTTNSQMIEGSFNSAIPVNCGSNPTYSSSTAPYLSNVVPAAKITGLSVYIISLSGANYFAVSAVTSIDDCGAVRGTAGMTVKQAYAIDKKIDDGLPQSGNVVAQYENWPGNAPGHLWAGGPYGNTLYTTATVGSATTCFDNGGNVGTMQYSLTQSNGNGVNCALSFRMQAGD